MKRLQNKAYTSQYLTRSIPEKINLIKKKSSQGMSMELFFKKGVGIKTLLNKTGRLLDFPGVFVISAYDDTPILVMESDHVLREVQNLVRANRVQDQEQIRSISNFFGFHTVLAGQQYLRSMQVTWLEVSNKMQRILLKKSLINQMLPVSQ